MALGDWSGWRFFNGKVGQHLFKDTKEMLQILPGNRYLPLVFGPPGGVKPWWQEEQAFGAMLCNMGSWYEMSKRLICQ